MKSNVCPSCKRPLFEHSLASSMPYIKRAIYSAVCAAGDLGITKWEIADKVYAMDPNGLNNIDVIKVHIAHINKNWLRQLGVEISARNRESKNGTGLYRIAVIEEAHA